MIQKIYSISFNRNYQYTKQTNPITDTQQNLYNKNLSHYDIKGVPASYITFKGANNTKNYIFTEEAQNILNNAENFAKESGNTEITPYHIIHTIIEETEENLKHFDNKTLESGIVDSVSPLSELVNNYAKKNILVNKEEREYFIEMMSDLKTSNSEYLKALPKTETQSEANEKLNLSEGLQNLIEQLVEQQKSDSNQKTIIISPYVLLGLAFNELTYKNIDYPANFIKDATSISLYKSNDEISEDYMKAYEKRAIEVWNKLALGSSLFVTSNYETEGKRLSTGIVYTVDAPKHGNFNSENTSIYVISDDAEPSTLLAEISTMQEEVTDKKMVYIIDMNALLAKCINQESGNIEIKPEILALGSLSNDNTKFVFLIDNDSYYSTMQNPAIKKCFSNFLTYKIPPIHTYEAVDIIDKNKSMLKGIDMKFSKEAREKAILYADKLEGIFPDKAIDLMKRISQYYSQEKKKINVKDVDEFAYIAQDLFNRDNGHTAIIYDTGKTLSNYYGKETTKKDIEAIVRQIRTGRIGTQGMTIYSKDEEAGSGRKYTAQVIAGEAKVPFLEISTSDFATTVEDDSDGRITPAQSMRKLFADIKDAAKQNEYKTAIMYINNFEEFAFSGPYLPGYKQAMAQLIREMAKAEGEDVNILVIGSTDAYYIDAIPVVARGFSQSIAVDTPAFNKQSRKEILVNRIAEKQLPLAGRTKKEKELLINKLVKLTEYMSFVEIKSLINKAEQIMNERGKKKASIGDFIEAYLQIQSGRTSHPEMPEYNKRATTSHECGHATNLEVMSQLYKDKGQPWHLSREVNFITLDPRGNFLGAVFEGKSENTDYPFEALFADIVCAYGGYSCEKMFFNMDGSSGISMDLAQATASAKSGVEHYGFGYNTGKISAAGGIKSGEFSDNVYKDVDVILSNAKIASDLITEGYKKFNEWFTDKYSKLIGTEECMVDGEDFRKMLLNWKQSQSKSVQENLKIMEDMLLDIIKASKNGIKYYELKKAL